MGITHTRAYLKINQTTAAKIAPTGIRKCPGIERLAAPPAAAMQRVARRNHQTNRCRPRTRPNPIVRRIPPQHGRTPDSVHNMCTVNIELFYQPPLIIIISLFCCKFSKRNKLISITSSSL